MKKFALRLVLLFVLCSLLVSIPEIRIAKAESTIYIRADGSIDPDTAPISTTDNVTYTFTDYINASSIIIERDNIVIDGADHTLQGTKSEAGINLNGRSNVTIKNMKIRTFFHGIWLNCSHNNVVAENSITDSTHGIYLQYHSSNNTIVGNNITESYSAIILLGSSNNLFRNNHMSDNKYNFDVSPNSVNDVDASNRVDGKPVYYWVNERDKTVPLDAGYVVLINCTNITMKNLSLANNWQGLLLSNTSNSKILNNNIANNWCGIQLYTSTNNTISVNNITNNMIGILMFDSSSYNSISGNNITKNREGIHIGLSSRNIISGNNITKNNWEGIGLANSTNNIVDTNLILDNGDGIRLIHSVNNIVDGNPIVNNTRGIFLDSSNNNTLSDNTVALNNQYGIYLRDSSNNTLCHNHFINNTYQPHSYNSTSSWDNGYPSGGNYWSNYIATDHYSGLYQNETGSDGIGDKPYVIDENNQDNYPLMGMFSDFKVTSEHHVQTICNSTISDFQFNGTTISFEATGEDGTTSFCRISIPTALMNEPFKVFVNGTQVIPTLLAPPNTTHSHLYFTYNHSKLEIVIIPEFPSFFILPLFMIATLIVAIVHKRRHTA